ncbi:MAG: 50S ribosomal protein L18 [Planctomycetota bacterium]
MTRENRERRLRRHLRVRRKLSGTAERPRLCVFRSERQIYCQLVDDVAQRTLGGCSTLTKRLREEFGKCRKQDAAKAVGKEIARIAQEHGVRKVAFDRAGYKYHGRIKALADAAREAGLQF